MVFSLERVGAVASGQKRPKILVCGFVVINLLGILEIVYLLFFQKEGKLWPALTRRGRQKIFIKEKKAKK